MVAAILKFNMAAILDLLSAITPKLRQVETFCLLLTRHFKGQGIPQDPLDVAVMAAMLNSIMADTQTGGYVIFATLLLMKG